MIGYIIIFIFFVVVLLYVMAIMPRMGKEAEKKPFRGRYFAHRGFHDNNSQAPENSIPAFLLAVEKGFGIELDVQLTRDNEMVVFHDGTLDRACKRKGRVGDYTFDQLKEFSLFESSQSIPRLTEVLELVNGRVPLIIELKVEWNPDKTCEKLNSILHTYKEEYCIESFSPLALIWYKKNRPDVLRGQLSTDFRKDKTEGNKVVHFLLKYLLLNFLARPDFIAYNYRYRKNPSLVLCRKLYGAMTMAWTVQSVEAGKVSEAVFDGIIFDHYLPERRQITKNW